MGVHWPVERYGDIPQEGVVAALPSRTVPAPLELAGRSSWECGAATEATPEEVVRLLDGWDDEGDGAMGMEIRPVEASRAGEYRPMYVVALDQGSGEKRRTTMDEAAWVAGGSPPMGSGADWGG